MKTSRIVIVVITCVYFLAVLFATVYSYTASSQNLPLATLVSADRGRIPKAAVFHNGDPTQDCVYTVILEEGPWGKRYILQSIPAFNVGSIDEDRIYLDEARLIETPFALTVESDYVYDGMPVRIV